MNERHEKSNSFCPYCLVALTKVTANGHVYCNHSLINCDYKVSPGARAPLTYEQCQMALKLRYIQRARSLEKQIRRFTKDLVAINRKIQSLDEISNY